MFRSGGFGSIFLAMHPLVSDEKIVMKVVKISAQKNLLWALRMEVEALRRIQSCVNVESRPYIIEQPRTKGLDALSSIWWSRESGTLSMLFVRPFDIFCKMRVLICFQTYYPQTLREVCKDHTRVTDISKLRNIIHDAVGPFSRLRGVAHACCR